MWNSILFASLVIHLLTFVHYYFGQVSLEVIFDGVHLSRLLSSNNHGQDKKKIRHFPRMNSLAELKSNIASKSGINANYHWRIGNSDGMLDVPNDPSKQYRLIVDVGLEIGSGFVQLLNNYSDLVLIGVESHPINFGITINNMYNVKSSVFSGDFKNILIIPTALSNTEGYVEFNENYVPACGSILKSRKDGWWCTHTTNTIEVPSLRLDTLLQLLPPNYSFFYLKIDTEGADHLVIEGGGEYVSRFELVSVECREPDDPGGELSRENTCHRVTLKGKMKSLGFNYELCVTEDCHFSKSKLLIDQAKSLFELREWKIGFSKLDPK